MPSSRSLSAAGTERAAAVVQPKGGKERLTIKQQRSVPVLARAV